MALIQTENLCVHHGDFAALHGVNLTLNRGEIVTVVGPNGSGKSTLLKALVGALPPTHGTITRAKGLKIGYVPQKLAIDETLPMRVRRFLDLPKRVSNDRAMYALELLGVSDIADRPISGLSGGQFQRVLLARAILNEPDILILDEATQGLDQPGEAQFYRQIEQLRTELNCAVLLVSHELHVVMSASDRVICLNGHVCCEGTPDVVSAAPAYRELFGSGTGGALALYRHQHDHSHDCDHDHDHHHHAEIH